MTLATLRGQRIERHFCADLLAAADICLAHNSGFDKGFVAQVVPEIHHHTWGCTCRGIPWKKLYPSLSSTALQSLSRYFRSQTGVAHRALGDVETTLNLVSLPGLLGARAFQHYILHKKIRRRDLTPEVVVLPDPTFTRQLIR